MWELATTLYVLLTGNAPDTMGRANFRWPPGGEGSLSAGEKAEWLRLHAVILRATEENPRERFIGLGAFVRAVTGDAVRISPPKKPLKESPKLAHSPKIIRAVLVGILISLGIMFVWSAYDNGRVPLHASSQERVEEPLPEPAAEQNAPEVIPYPAHCRFKDWQAERQALGWDIEDASKAFKNNPLEWDNQGTSKTFKDEP